MVVLKCLVFCYFKMLTLLKWVLLWMSTGRAKWGTCWNLSCNMVMQMLPHLHLCLNVAYKYIMSRVCMWHHVNFGAIITSTFCWEEKLCQVSVGNPQTTVHHSFLPLTRPSQSLFVIIYNYVIRGQIFYGSFCSSISFLSLQCKIKLIRGAYKLEYK